MVCAATGDLLEEAHKLELTINNVVPRVFPGRGLGTVAVSDHDKDSLLISVPTASVRSAKTVPEDLCRILKGVTVQGLLATDLMLEKPETRSIWRTTLPSRSSFEQAIPFYWEASLRKLLPDAAVQLLRKQDRRLSSDWAVISAALPSLSYQEYLYYWFIVGTRTFYYNDLTSSDSFDSEDCLALLPFADLFNHSNAGCAGCEVKFSSEAYTFTTKKKIFAGDELFINYGEHSNDFLLAEYGFLLENNQYDVVSLDPIFLGLFDDKDREILESSSFWANYTLDASKFCYRTEVAKRLLCMPLDLWLKSMQKGFDEDDDYRATVDEIVQKNLEKYVLLAQDTMKEISKLPARFAAQQTILTKRWGQILSIIDYALANIRTNKTKPAQN